MQNKLTGPEAAASQELIRDLRILGNLDPDAMEKLAEAMNSISEQGTKETIAAAIQTMIGLLRELNGGRSIPPQAEVTGREPWRPSYEREVEAFNRALPSLLATRAGKYVAMTGGDVVDEDNDEIALAERTAALHRKQFVLIRKVTLEEPIEDIPSVEAEY